MTHIHLANNLTDKLKTDALEMLKNEPEDFFYNPNSVLKRIIASKYNNHVIDDETLDKALESAVLKQGENDLKYLQPPRKEELPYADFLPRPEFLVYAIQKRIFVGEEVRSIPLSPGTTLDGFCRQYGQKDLINNLKKELKQMDVEKPGSLNDNDQVLLDQLENDNFMRKENPS